LQGIRAKFLIGDTLTELTDAIRTAYSKIMHDPIVAINLTDFLSPITPRWVSGKARTI